MYVRSNPFKDQLVFGLRKYDGSVGNLFAERIIGLLPDIIPTASIEVVRRHRRILCHSEFIID